MGILLWRLEEGEEVCPVIAVAGAVRQM